MSNIDSPERLYQFTAINSAGAKIADRIRAKDKSAAIKALSAKGLTPIKLEERAEKAAEGKRGALSFTDRVTVLRQMALMMDAGVGLLESIDTVAIGITSLEAKAQFTKLSTALKRGATFAEAMETETPIFPFYVYSMIRVGEATGQLNEVLRDAANQMANEDRLRRDLANAMTYPAFLGGVGLAAVLFIFTQVVPRFSVMIGDKRDKLPMISRWVIETGELASNHVPLLLALIGAAIGGAVFAFLNPAVRTSAYRIAHKVPLIGDLLKYREITTWARLTGFALRNGVGLLEASNLGRKATPEGGFQLALEQFERDLKAGVAVDESLGRHTTLTSMDLSLLRAGQKSGSLGKMFDFLADGYDDKLSDMMKRLAALIEPLAIGIISVLVGVVALSLVLALSSVYDTVL